MTSLPWTLLSTIYDWYKCYTYLYWSEAKLLCIIWKVKLTYSYQNIDQGVICVLLLSMGSTLQIDSIKQIFLYFLSSTSKIQYLLTSSKIWWLTLNLVNKHLFSVPKLTIFSIKQTNERFFCHYVIPTLDISLCCDSIQSSKPT